MRNMSSEVPGLDRFTFAYVKAQWSIVVAMRLKKIDTLNQELMLRIMSEEDRLVLDSNILVLRDGVLKNKENFNFYITTDFATSEKQKADFSVISVWAVNNNRDFFWVDGICKRQDMSVNVKDLFDFCLRYKPQQVGIEVRYQQQGFVLDSRTTDC